MIFDASRILRPAIVFRRQAAARMWRTLPRAAHQKRRRQLISAAEENHADRRLLRRQPARQLRVPVANAG